MMKVGYCEVEMLGEGECGGEGETDKVLKLEDFNRTIADVEGGGW